MSEISKLVALDPILSAQLIKYAKSPLYRRSREVTNVSTAVGLLGLKNVTVAIMMVTMKSFKKKNNVLHDEIFYHGTVISAFSRIVAKKYTPSIADDVELIGMLHDIGASVFSVNYTEDYLQLHHASTTEGVALDALERPKFGFDRDEVARYLGGEFRLAESTKQIISAYHQTADVYDFNDEKNLYIAVLSLAHHLEKHYNNEEEQLLETIPISLEILKSHFSISEEDWHTLVEECGAFLQERFNM